MALWIADGMQCHRCELDSFLRRLCSGSFEPSHWPLHVLSSDLVSQERKEVASLCLEPQWHYQQNLCQGLTERGK